MKRKNKRNQKGGKKNRKNKNRKPDKSKPGKWSIAIHGGCGGIYRSRFVQPYINFLHDCCEKAAEMLENGETAISVVEFAVSEMENCELFNCGRGSVLNENGKVEMDACIVNGKSLRSGGICAVKNVKNPISLAKSLLKSSPLTYILVGEGAKKYAVKNSLEICDDEYFLTGLRIKQQLRRKKEKGVELDHDNKEEEEEEETITDDDDDEEWGEKEKEEERIKFSLKNHDTVGCVCLDIYGDLAAGTSTGGLGNKLQGRVGDSGVVGTGTYANNRTLAISCTGTGEKIIQRMIAYDIHARMLYQGLSLYQASKSVIDELEFSQEYGVAGWIAIDKDGSVVMDYNTTGMFRCSMSSEEEDKKPNVYVWEDTEEKKEL